MSGDDELLGELRDLAATVDPPPPRAIRRARKLAPVPQRPRPPMSAGALLLVVRRALYEVGLALADADGLERAPYNLAVPGRDDDVLTELVAAYDALTRVGLALIPPSSSPPPPATG